MPIRDNELIQVETQLLQILQDLSQEFDIELDLTPEQQLLVGPQARGDSIMRRALAIRRDVRPTRGPQARPLARIIAWARNTPGLGWASGVTGTWDTAHVRDACVAATAYVRVTAACSVCGSSPTGCVCRASITGAWCQPCVVCSKLRGGSGREACRCVQCAECHTVVRPGPAPSDACERCSKYGRAKCNACCVKHPAPPGEWRNTTPTRWHGAPTAGVPRFVGLEIEIGGFRNGNRAPKCEQFEAVERWGGHIKCDGSVRGNAPREIAMFPARGAALRAMARDVGGVLTKLGAAPNGSCGGHIHVDVRDLDQRHMATLVALWKVIEGAMLAAVPRSRRSSSYARRFANDIEVVHTNNGVPTGHVYWDPNRYHALNTHTGKSTVEFRFWNSTVDPTQLFMRGAVCSRLVQWAATHTVADVAPWLEARAARRRGTGTRALRAILTRRQFEWYRAQVRAHARPRPIMAGVEVTWNGDGGYTAVAPVGSYDWRIEAANGQQYTAATNQLEVV